jgi:hypothetical protein
MSAPSKALAVALEQLQKLQDLGKVGLSSKDFPNRRVRELLLKYGFLREITKGWYITSDPAELSGQTTSWYSSYWAFMRDYLNDVTKNNWCLTPDESLLFHTGKTTVPDQLIVVSPNGTNRSLELSNGHSVFRLRSNLPPTHHLEFHEGIWVYTLPASLVFASPSMYANHATDIQIGLAQIVDASQVLPFLLENNHTYRAGRLAGALRRMGKTKIADQIGNAFHQLDLVIRESDPFENDPVPQFKGITYDPFVYRLQFLWEHMRPVVLKHAPAPSEIPSRKELFAQVDQSYVADAYHSLSIERYRVTHELIRSVSSGDWFNNQASEAIKRSRDALAARGYYQAFTSVRGTIERILQGGNPGQQLDKDLSLWYTELFSPSVVAGILTPVDLAGNRNHLVYISNSKHIPPPPKAVREALPVLMELLSQEEHPFVRAVLGHFLFVYIHPYMDGNGRMARFLMNVFLVTGGYPWTIIPSEERESYMAALEEASVCQNIQPFAQFIASLVHPRS